MNDRTHLQLSHDVLCVGTDHGADTFGMKRLPAGTFVKDVQVQEHAMIPDSTTTFSASYDGETWHPYYTIEKLEVDMRPADEVNSHTSGRK